MSNLDHTLIEALNNDVDEFFRHKQTLPSNSISQRKKEHYKQIFKTRRFSFHQSRQISNTRCKILYRQS